MDTSVPEGFGLPQKDADTFKPIAIKSKKRTADQVSGGVGVPADDLGKKQLKLDDAN